MDTSRFAVFGFILAASVGLQSASAAEILMPVGSTVWMKFDAAACPDADFDDCAGSNQAGIAPPNGIPNHFVTNGVSTATGYAEILPDRVRTYIISNAGAVMNASFQDTYTVGGTAAGPFEITFQFRVTGSMNTVPAGPFHQLLAGNVQAKIGTFEPDPLVNENIRVAAFDAGASADTGAQSLFAMGSVPIDITASYTKTGVNISDVFDIGYQIRSAFSKGEIDLRNTGVLSIILPEGVTLTSALAESLLPVPGDYNFDSTVDAADYVVWRKTDSGNSQGYADWLANFGEGMGGGSAGASHPQTSVPEPATLVMLIVAAVGIRLRRRHIASECRKLNSA